MEEFIKELLDSREERYFRQMELIEDYKLPLISFMLNIPGMEKKNEKLEEFQRLSIDMIEKRLGDKIKYCEFVSKETGMYYLAIVDMDSRELKLEMIDMENSPEGRIWDIDVFDENKKQISRKDLGQDMRKCLLCDDYAKVCIRERRHSYEELIAAFYKIIDKAK